MQGLGRALCAGRMPLPCYRPCLGCSACRPRRLPGCGAALAWACGVCFCEPALSHSTAASARLPACPPEAKSGGLGCRTHATGRGPRKAGVACARGGVGAAAGAWDRSSWVPPGPLGGPAHSVASHAVGTGLSSCVSPSAASPSARGACSFPPLFLTPVTHAELTTAAWRPSSPRTVCGRAFGPRGAACVPSYLTPTTLKLSWC